MGDFTRRGFLWIPAVAASTRGLIAAAGCGAPTTPTGDGPFYLANVPFRAVLREDGMPGTRLIFHGHVLDAGCKPLPDAVVDLWHSNDNGEYDTKGFRLRGRLRTDSKGAFEFETIQPRGYPTGNGGYRCAHFHVKIHRESQPTLTSELYFPGDPKNATDGAFTEKRMVKIESDGKGKVAEFDFVV